MSTGALHELVAKALRQNPDRQLSPEQIAEVLIETYPERFEQKQRSLGGRSQLLWQLTREIYAQRPKIVRQHVDIAVDVSKRPLRMFVAGDAALNQSAEVEDEGAAEEPAADERPGDELREHALYEPLQRFLADDLRVFSKRIREGTSKNRRGRNGNKWLHPDIVGMSAPGGDWSDVVRQCANALPTQKAKLISIEVKTRLTVGNLRESFFQTVSNSLWANQAFLAASQVSGENTWAELRTLCALHGIGFLSLDPENHSESRVTIPARDREEIDWASADRIARENADFHEFLKNVLNYLNTGQIMHRIWDFAPGTGRA